jgi:small subunit ribosomal protein S20
MANIKSAKKRARQDVVRRQVNLARKTAVKTAIKKVLTAVSAQDYEASVESFKAAEAQLRRAKNKGVLHGNTVDRKVSRLALKVAALKKEEASSSK